MFARVNYEAMFVRVHFWKVWSANGCGPNNYIWFSTKTHLRMLVRVAFTRMLVRVCFFVTTCKTRAKHSECGNHFLGSFREPSDGLFPPPDVCTGPLWGQKKQPGANIAFQMFVRVTFFALTTLPGPTFAMLGPRALERG